MKDARIPVPSELIDRAVRRFEFESRAKARTSVDRTPQVITISRQLGSGGRKIAEALSAQLHWPLWASEILDVLAEQTQLRYQARMFESLDEQARGAIDNLFSAILGGASKHVYLHLLPKAILTVAQNDAIILGRGAHLLLPSALRVRIVASQGTRVANLRQFEGIGEEAARERIAASDHDREAWLREFASRLHIERSALETRVWHDLIVNTDSIGIDEAAGLILTAAGQRFQIEKPSRLAL